MDSSDLRPNFSHLHHPRLSLNIHPIKTMSKVWIVNYAGHDYRDAERFGELTNLTEGTINPLRVDRLMVSMAYGIGKLADESDFLLISGTPTLNALAAMLWLRRFNSINLLQWNAQTKRYEQSYIAGDHMDILLDEAITT